VFLSLSKSCSYSCGISELQALARVLDMLNFYCGDASGAGCLFGGVAESLGG
jgi:hypothetical protein